MKILSKIKFTKVEESEILCKIRELKLSEQQSLMSSLMPSNRRKTPSCPTYPKKPRNAFHLFVAEQEKLGVGVVAGVGERRNVIATMWKSMNEEQRLPFQQQAEQDKKRYERELFFPQRVKARAAALEFIAIRTFRNNVCLKKIDKGVCKVIAELVYESAKEDVWKSDEEREEQRRKQQSKRQKINGNI